MFEQELAEAAKLNVVSSTHDRGSIDPVLYVWSGDVRVNFVPEWGKNADRPDNIAVHVWNMDINETSFPYHETTFIGMCRRDQVLAFMRILGSCSPRYMSYALRHAGIIEHEECVFCEGKHASSALHEFRHMSAKGV